MKGLGQHIEDQREAKTAGEYRQAAEEHTQTLKSFWKNFLVSGLFVVAAVVIILACLAWFFNNSQVTATGVGVSAAGARYSLVADTDDGSNAQIGYYERTPKERENLNGLDLSDSMTVTLTSNLNNYNAGTIYPGARGEIKFKVVPIAKDLKSVEIDLSRILKTKTPDTSIYQELNGLVEGHVLFFRDCTNGFYSNRVEDSKITISSDDFKKDNSSETTETVEVTLHWVWPEYLQNYVYVGNANYYKNLFAGDNSDYRAMQSFVNNNKGKYYYGSVGETSVTNAPSLGPEMRSTSIATCAALYNDADEFIGNNVQYLQLRIGSREV